MSVVTAAGTKIYIGGTGALASESAWTLIGEVVNGGEFGPEYELITHTALDNRNVQKFKGHRNDGSQTIQLGRDITDDGQSDLSDAVESDLKHNFKIELNDDIGETGDSPTTFTFKALAMSFKTNIGDLNSIVAATAVLEIESGTITETPAATET